MGFLTPPQVKMLNVNVFLMNVVFFLYLTIKNTQQQHNESCAVVVFNGFTQSHMNNVGQTTTRYAGVHKKLYKKITFHSTIRMLKSIVKKKVILWQIKQIVCHTQSGCVNTI